MANILLTGRAGAGKTTVIVRLAELLGARAAGFYTRELRRDSRRVGFEIVTLAGAKAVLAHVDLSSPLRVGRYGVLPVNLDIACEEVHAALADPGKKCILIDEIGRMELFSRLFRETVEKALDDPRPVVATILAGHHSFADTIKRRPDVEIIEVTPASRGTLPEALHRRLTACF
ncbi:MAG: nucleoside-triphosphatase [Bacillota bacterium]